MALGSLQTSFWKIVFAVVTIQFTSRSSERRVGKGAQRRAHVN
jgi:hypothetical protein